MFCTVRAQLFFVAQDLSIFHCILRKFVRTHCRIDGGMIVINTGRRTPLRGA
jgi:hypothetical protein